MTATLKINRTTFWQPLAIAAAIGIATIAPAKAILPPHLRRSPTRCNST